MRYAALRPSVFWRVFVLWSSLASAQSNTATGSIQGTVTDPSGATIGGAEVTITNTADGTRRDLTSNTSGLYNSGTLTPGSYLIRIHARGFEASETTVVAQVGNVSTANMQLKVGSEKLTIKVSGSTLAVNTEQPSVEGVLTTVQIDQLPINGRNFLDLAQLEPGVQIQDGTNFDPTKVGYESISFGGRFGRTARIQVDGVDVSDETVGTTTGNIPTSAIQEFQIAQSTLDLSNDLSSTGVVNVTTRSGTSQLHGEAFGLFRTSELAAQLPHPLGTTSSYQRDQFGGRLGGPIKKKLFYFADGEWTLQHAFAPVAYAPPFEAFTGGFQNPFKTADALGRVDYTGFAGATLFYRFNYSQIRAIGTAASNSLQPYLSKNYLRQHVVGADFIRGPFSHSIRFGCLSFHNTITDAVIGSGLPLADFPGGGLHVSIAVNNGPATGPNSLAPQATSQRNIQLKYDGSRTWGRHVLRFGVSYNHILAWGFASFLEFAPNVTTNLGSFPNLDYIAFANAGPYCTSGFCGAANPLNWPVEYVVLGNGQGYASNDPAFGHPAGRLGPDNRIGVYLGDTWNISRGLAINIGLRYVRDTGRTDSDLPGIPQLNNLVSDFPNLGARVRQPNFNLAPQVGIVWDPWRTGKTAMRGGIGIYYENNIFNLQLFDRSFRLPTGAFWQSAVACSAGNIQPLAGAPNLSATTQDCGSPDNPVRIGASAMSIGNLQNEYQQSIPFSLSNPNPNYIPVLLDQGVNLPGNVFAPNYQTPRALQMNFGIQRELKPGLIVSADYVRNVTTHYLTNIDVNHTGDVRYFNRLGAQQAIAATLSNCGAASIDAGIANCAGSATAISTSITGRGLTIQDFANNGLDSQNDLGGNCANSAGCAFGGFNPLIPALYVAVPAGRSVYNALDLELIANVNQPMSRVRTINLQASYSLSRFVNSGEWFGPADQDFGVVALDNRDPNRYSGPSLLDRTNQLSFGLIVNASAGFNASVIGHFDSPLALPIRVPGFGAAAIFQTDFNGDGTTDDLMPGTHVGSFGRGISANTINTFISKYNSNAAQTPTPAASVLSQTGLFTDAELKALGAVPPTVDPAPTGQVGLGWLRTFDLRIGWAHRFTLGEHHIEAAPSVTAFNLFNFANFDLPPNVMSGLLNSGAGSINGTTTAERITNRVGTGTGVFALGAPRSFEFGLRIAF